MQEKELNAWWYGTEFKIMERITKLRQWYFSPEDGYQEFVDVCDKWWESLSKSEKQYIYNEWN